MSGMGREWERDDVKEPERVFSRRERNREVSSLGVARNWAGRISGVPKTASKGDKFMSSWGQWKERKNKGIHVNHWGEEQNNRLWESPSGLVKTFLKTIGLRMKSSDGDLGNVQKFREMRPNKGSALWPSVGSHSVWSAKMLNPVVTKRFNTGGCCGGWKWSSLSSVVGSVHDGVDVCIALGGREMANFVHMTIGKSARRNRNVSGGRG